MLCLIAAHTVKDDWCFIIHLWVGGLTSDILASIIQL